MATTNPLVNLMGNVPKASHQNHVIAGIEVDVYGVKELRSDVKDVRNHGSRLVDPVSNQAWRDGNPRHAQDMFSIFQGTAADTSQLINYLPAYVFPGSEHSIQDHIALGVSLGGHSVWHLLLHEPRITTGIVVVGCPDYLSLMKDRARLSKLKTWTRTSPPGKAFIGSEDFPHSLIEAIRRYDPTGYFFDVNGVDTQSDSEGKSRERKRLSDLLDNSLRGKRLLNLAGGSDKLVPYAKSEPFMTWLKGATSPTGWYSNGNIEVRDIVYKGVGHEMTSEMLHESLQFIEKSLQRTSKVTSSKL